MEVEIMVPEDQPLVPHLLHHNECQPIPFEETQGIRRVGGFYDVVEQFLESQSIGFQIIVDGSEEEMANLGLCQLVLDMIDQGRQSLHANIPHVCIIIESEVDEGVDVLLELLIPQHDVVLLVRGGLCEVVVDDQLAELISVDYPHLHQVGVQLVEIVEKALQLIFCPAVVLLTQVPDIFRPEHYSQLRVETLHPPLAPLVQAGIYRIGLLEVRDYDLTILLPKSLQLDPGLLDILHQRLNGLPTLLLAPLPPVGILFVLQVLLCQGDRQFPILYPYFQGVDNLQDNIIKTLVIEVLDCLNDEGAQVDGVRDGEILVDGKDVLSLPELLLESKLAEPVGSSHILGWKLSLIEVLILYQTHQHIDEPSFVCWIELTPYNPNDLYYLEYLEYLLSLSSIQQQFRKDRLGREEAKKSIPQEIEMLHTIQRQHKVEVEYLRGRCLCVEHLLPHLIDVLLQLEPHHLLLDVEVHEVLELLQDLWVVHQYIRVDEFQQVLVHPEVLLPVGEGLGANELDQLIQQLIGFLVVDTVEDQLAEIHHVEHIQTDLLLNQLFNHPFPDFIVAVLDPLQNRCEGVSVDFDGIHHLEPLFRVLGHVQQGDKGEVVLISQLSSGVNVLGEKLEVRVDFDTHRYPGVQSHVHYLEVEPDQLLDKLIAVFPIVIVQIHCPQQMDQSFSAKHSACHSPLTLTHSYNQLYHAGVETVQSIEFTVLLTTQKCLLIGSLDLT